MGWLASTSTCTVFPGLTSNTTPEPLACANTAGCAGATTTGLRHRQSRTIADDQLLGSVRRYIVGNNRVHLAIGGVLQRQRPPTQHHLGGAELRFKRKRQCRILPGAQMNAVDGNETARRERLIVRIFRRADDAPGLMAGVVGFA